ncbi:hypothetical protein Btru_013341 [Bulinus truncatus]|nr:hypothetical protein Btru_013341 [Bulinus truncatus]
MDYTVDQGPDTISNSNVEPSDSDVMEVTAPNIILFNVNDTSQSSERTNSDDGPEKLINKMNQEENDLKGKCKTSSNNFDLEVQNISLHNGTDKTNAGTLELDSDIDKEEHRQENLNKHIDLNQQKDCTMIEGHSLSDKSEKDAHNILINSGLDEINPFKTSIVGSDTDQEKDKLQHSDTVNEIRQKKEDLPNDDVLPDKTQNGTQHIVFNNGGDTATSSELMNLDSNPITLNVDLNIAEEKSELQNSNTDFEMNQEKNENLLENHASPDKTKNETQNKMAKSEADKLDCFNTEVQIKQEIVDIDYERISVQYRGKSIVVYSDSDSSSSLGSPVPIPLNVDEEEDELDEHPNNSHPQQSASHPVRKFNIRTEGEVFPEELPPLEYLTISPDQNVQLEPVGTVSGIVGVLVVIKALPDSPALYDDTVLFLEGRRPLGLIFETFGTVHQPFYSVRFNYNKDIIDQNIELGNRVYFAPKASNLTKYVFISELKKIKFDDASWEHDNEPPPTQIEFSDDEEEKLAKQRQKNQSRKSDNFNGTHLGRKKRKRNFHSDNNHHQENGGPQLLQGDLNKNPFGDRSHSFQGHVSKQWPPKENYSSGNKQWPPKESSADSSQIQSQNSFRKSQPAFFGEKPNWHMQPRGYPTCQSLPGQQNMPQNNSIPFDNVQQAASFGNFSLPPPPQGLNFNIPPPPMTNSRPYFGANPSQSPHFMPGMNNQYIPAFNPCQPPPLFSSQHNPTMSSQHPPHTPSQYPANIPSQGTANKPSQYPSHHTLQNSPQQSSNMSFR